MAPRFKVIIIDEPPGNKDLFKASVFRETDVDHSSVLINIALSTPAEPAAVEKQDPLPHAMSTRFPKPHN